MGKVWFVTGSTRGLGRDFVEAALSRPTRSRHASWNSRPTSNSPGDRSSDEIVTD
ncbi:hypothetical protein ACFSKW_44355 [Nonomuraea mangrovi]|uniref:SDR family NAD(P)-dependent oxidoreductase n=1 Tax=Nonomuraea mangrovi TaxID=2316207 RepID=A0ABW4TC03_9ACTN